MDLDQALRGRRSIRCYLNKGVPEELIRRVVEAATFAPSAKNGQQWRFTVLTGDAKRELTDLFRRELEKVSKRIGRQNMGSSFSSCSIMEEAPVVIMVWNAGERGWETELHSVAAAIQNTLLEAYSLELGTLDWRHFLHVGTLETVFGQALETDSSRGAWVACGKSRAET